MALDPEVAAQISAESRESFALIARQRAAHAEEVATGYSQVGVQQQSLNPAMSASMLTGIINQQANAETALKNSGFYPTYMNPPAPPKPTT